MVWYSPVDDMPDAMDVDSWRMARHSLGYVAELVAVGDWEGVARTVDKNHSQNMYAQQRRPQHGHYLCDLRVPQSYHGYHQRQSSHHEPQSKQLRSAPCAQSGACRRYIHWRCVGKYVVGTLLGLGSERGLGTDNHACILTHKQLI